MPNPVLPADFDPEMYLRLNPDVARAEVDPKQHYIEFGKAEGRIYHEDREGDQLLDFVSSFPSDQAIVNLFQGEWSSAFPPHTGLVSKPGTANLFEDDRISFAESVLGPFSGMSICELGPLEGAHTFMLHQRGATSIHAVEANKDAFLKCLCVKEIFNLTRARFVLGDAISFLEGSTPRYDVIIASGILYHMADPLRLLSAMVSKTDRLFIWTHYYDAKTISQRKDVDLFQPCVPIQDGPYNGSKRLYPSEALSWAGFSGGPDAYAVWLERASIETFLKESGFKEMETSFDHITHPNGPAFAIAARR